MKNEKQLPKGARKDVVKGSLIESARSLSFLYGLSLEEVAELLEEAKEAITKEE